MWISTLISVSHNLGNITAQGQMECNKPIHIHTRTHLYEHVDMCDTCVTLYSSVTLSTAQNPKLQRCCTIAGPCTLTLYQGIYVSKHINGINKILIQLAITDMLLNAFLCLIRGQKPQQTSWCVLAFPYKFVILGDRRGQLPSWCLKIALGMCHLLPTGVEWQGLRGPVVLLLPLLFWWHFLTKSLGYSQPPHDY